MTNLIKNQNKNKNESQRGFTLIELIIYMGLLSVFMTLLTSMFISILEVQMSSVASNSLEQESQYVISRLQHDLNNAEIVLTPENLGDETSTFALNIDGQNHTYASNSGYLTLQSPVGNSRLHSADVELTNFQVTRVGNVGGVHSFLIDLTLQSTIEDVGERETKNLQLVLGLR